MSACTVPVMCWCAVRVCCELHVCYMCVVCCACVCMFVSLHSSLIFFCCFGTREIVGRYIFITSALITSLMFVFDYCLCKQAKYQLRIGLFIQVPLPPHFQKLIIMYETLLFQSDVKLVVNFF